MRKLGAACSATVATLNQGTFSQHPQPMLDKMSTKCSTRGARERSRFQDLDAETTVFSAGAACVAGTDYANGGACCKLFVRFQLGRLSHIRHPIGSILEHQLTI